MIQDGDTYYRFTKNESIGTIVMDKSDSVLGEFTEIPSKSLTTDLMAQQGAVEGPIIFKMNEKTEDGKDQWCLMVDRFARGQGYYPLITTDLSSGEFRLLGQDEYSFPSDSKFRHGYVMPVTASEYDALQRKWGESDYVSTYLLEQTIADAKAVDGSLYTEETYQALLEALGVAEAALETVQTTAEADAAAAELQMAIDALKPKEEETVTLTGIELKAPAKAEYQTGETLDLTGMTVNAVYSDGVKKDVTKDVTVEGFDNTKAGTQTITVTYTVDGKAYTASFEVVVKDNSGTGGNPGGENPDGNKPDGNKPDGSKPDGSKPDGSKPNGNKPDSSKPDGNKQDGAVQTGDSTPIGMAAGLLAAAGAAIVIERKRKRS